MAVAAPTEAPVADVYLTVVRRATSTTFIFTATDAPGNTMAMMATDTTCATAVSGGVARPVQFVSNDPVLQADAYSAEFSLRTAGVAYLCYRISAGTYSAIANRSSLYSAFWLRVGKH